MFERSRAVITLTVLDYLTRNRGTAHTVDAICDAIKCSVAQAQTALELLADTYLVARHPHNTDERPMASALAALPAPAPSLPPRVQTDVAPEIALLQTIPGVGAVAATAIVAEIGVDMQRFASAKHLASWAGVCPGNNQSAGRRGSSKPTGGNRWLKGVLGEVACSIARSPGSYLHAQFQRLARRGRHKALVAVAHSVLRIIYFMLRDKRSYVDLGPDYFDKLDATRVERYHVRRLEQLGFTVALSPQVST